MGWVIYNMRKCAGDKTATPDKCILDFGKKDREAQVDPVDKNKRTADIFKGISRVFASMTGKRKE